KKVFLDTNPFSTNYHIAGGDDDIFVSMASSKGIKINTSVKPESWVHTDSKKTWKAYFHQKKRHISTSFFYTAKPKWLLGNFSSLNILMFGFYCYVAFQGYFYIATGILCVFYIVASLAQEKALKTLNADRFRFVWPIYDLAFAFYLV